MRIQRTLNDNTPSATRTRACFRAAVLTPSGQRTYLYCSCSVAEASSPANSNVAPERLCGGIIAFASCSLLLLLLLLHSFLVSAVGLRRHFTDRRILWADVLALFIQCLFAWQYAAGCFFGLLLSFLSAASWHLLAAKLCAYAAVYFLIGFNWELIASGWAFPSFLVCLVDCCLSL